MTKSVLIVDDNSANLYMLKSLLEGEGLEVTMAENGKAALEKARANPPDLIVTDILMPVMDGYALCREWKSDETLKHIPLVFYTATYTESPDEEFALSLGADRFIVKPQEPEIFMNMIKEVLEEKYTARQAAAKPLGEEMEFFRRHNEILFKKLEKKMLALESANQKLKISEECYRLSFQNASDVIYTMDSNLILLSISPSIERILGYRPQDFIGRPMSDFAYILTPASYEQAVADIRLVLQGETNIETIYQFIAKDGTIKYGEVSRAPLMREGTIIGVISVARDITDRKRAEEALRASREILRAVLDAIPVRVFWKDRDLKYLGCNTPFARDAGLEKPEDLVGKDDYAMGWQDQAELYRADDRGVIESGTPRLLIEEPQTTPSGGTIQLLTSKIPLRNADGTVGGVLGTYIDITDRKRAEDKLIASEKKYRDLYDFLPIPVYEMDLGGNITAANRATYKLFGGTEEDLKKGFKAWQVLSPEDVVKSEMNIQMLLKGDHVTRTEYTLRRLDGTVFPSIIISSVIHDNDKAVGLRGAIIDITERRQQEEEREKMLLRRQGINHLQQSLLATDKLENKLRTVTENIVSLFDADFSRIWLIQPGDLCEQGCIHADVHEGPHICRYRDRCLHLMASSGRYTHTDGKIHRRVPIGCYKIGRVASDEDHKFLTNDVQNDPRVHNHEWARELGLVSFVGYQLRAPGGETLGVLALFAKHPISSAEDAMLDGISSTVALVIRNDIAEKLTRESEEQYRTVFENHAAVKFLIDPDTGIIIEANKAAVDYYGWSHEQLKRMKIQEINILPPEDVKREMEKARTQKRVYFEFRHRRADGSVRDVEVFSSKIDVKGKDFLHSIVHDITERKKAEGKLRESEEKFRSLVEHMHDAILLTKPDGSILDANKAACEMFGVSLDEIRKVGRGGLVDETDPRLHTALRKRNRMGTASAEITMLRANGEKFSAEITSTIFTDENGQQKTSMIIRDITDRKRAEDTLRKSEARFRSYFELPLIGIAITSPEKGWLEVNDRLSAILGYSRQELKGLTWAELTYPEDIAADVEQFDRILAGEIDSYMMDKRFIRKDGEVIWTSLAAGCVHKQDGAVDYFVALIQDITAQKESVDRIRKTLGAAVNAIAVTVETRDPYTAGHQRRVSDLARAIATEMGLASDQIDGIRTAAIIHDLGKISVPAEILTRSTRLTELEFSLIKTHAQSGYDILKDIEFPWPIARMVIEHHERMDGSGYPNGLTGDRLLIESRILSIADVVEAMASHRPYRAALGLDAALAEIEKNKGILYDRDAVEACVRLFREKGFTFV